MVKDEGHKFYLLIALAVVVVAAATGIAISFSTSGGSETTITEVDIFNTVYEPSTLAKPYSLKKI